jgi:hypothetical protein
MLLVRRQDNLEARLLLAQRWAERKRKLLVILPADLHKPWRKELADKCHLPSVILQTRTLCTRINSLEAKNLMFAKLHGTGSYRRGTPSAECLPKIEPHRLIIKQAISPFPKVLLTATPPQNSLLELYGQLGGVSGVQKHCANPSYRSEISAFTSRRSATKR